MVPSVEYQGSGRCGRINSCFVLIWGKSGPWQRGSNFFMCSLSQYSSDQGLLGSCTGVDTWKLSDPSFGFSLAACDSFGEAMPMSWYGRILRSILVLFSRGHQLCGQLSLRACVFLLYLILRDGSMLNRHCRDVP